MTSRRALLASDLANRTGRAWHTAALGLVGLLSLSGVYGISVPRGEAPRDGKAAGWGNSPVETTLSYTDRALRLMVRHS
jgi:hypothetical protein